MLLLLETMLVVLGRVLLRLGLIFADNAFVRLFWGFRLLK